MRQIVAYKIAVVAIVEYKGLVLVGKKINSDHFLSNAWHIPGGKPKPNETEEQALLREIKEEAGIEIKVNRFLDEGIVPDANLRARWYLCSPLAYNLKPGGDLAEVKFVPKSKVLKICDPTAISLWPTPVVEYFRK